MRKMTKTVAVLAAMSAMTVASASMAFAATGEVKNLSALDKAVAAAGANTGEWDGDDVKGWSFTPTGESKLKGTWAQIDNVWYYFDKDGIMAQEELLYLEGETYYFNADGSMMANGWVGFDQDSDVVYDYDLDIEENISDIVNPVFLDKEDAYETIWMYFNEDGTAKDDEWYQSEAGLWYRFDDIIMVCGDFDHVVGDDVYGFDENGAMLVGWAENYNDLMKTAPNTDERVWYYYDSNGKKFAANRGLDQQFAWKKIGPDWYCFTTEIGAYAVKDNDGDIANVNQSVSASVGTLIVNTYFTNNSAGKGTTDYYYVDKKGVMATGVTTVDKEALYVAANVTEKVGGVDTTVAAAKNDDWSEGTKVKDVTGDKSVTVLFDSNGKAKGNTWDGNNFYANMYPNNIWEFNTSKANETVSDDAVMVAVTGRNVPNGNNFKAIKGALVKSAFINKDGYFYVDSYGDKVVNSAVEVGKFDIDTTMDPDTYVDADFAAANFWKETEANKSSVECKAYVLFGSNGKGYEAGDIDTGRTVKVGSKKYTATDAEFLGMQVFIYVNWN